MQAHVSFLSDSDMVVKQFDPTRADKSDLGVYRGSVQNRFIADVHDAQRNIQ
jgi:hypothetical protein